MMASFRCPKVFLKNSGVMTNPTSSPNFTTTGRRMLSALADKEMPLPSA
jgi:hypothetical protein